MLHNEIHYVPVGDGEEEVLVRNVLHYVPVLLSNHHLQVHNVLNQLFLWRLYLMILRGATSLLGALEGVGLKIETFLVPEMARAKPLVMMLHPSNNYVPRHKYNRYINSYSVSMYRRVSSSYTCS